MPQPTEMTKPHSTEDVYDRLVKHAQTVERNKAAAINEATTTNFLVEPFLDAVLGYSPRDPKHVAPQLDVNAPGKNEKVDLALLHDGDPVILVEVKKRDTTLGKNVAQLKYYFTFVRTAKFAVLTDGITWMWFKSDPKQSSDMEDMPFLTHDAESPNKLEAEWLTAVSRCAFEAAELETRARRIELENRILQWVSLMFNSPGADDVSPLIAALELKVPKRDHGLIREAAISAMDRFVKGRVEPPPTKELGFYGHTGYELEVSDGTAWRADRSKTAWRIADGEWQSARGATATATAVLVELLKCDKRRDNPDALASAFGLLKRLVSPNTNNWWLVPGYSDLYFFKAGTTSKKVEFLSDLAENLEFDPPADSPLSRVPKIEWWIHC